MGIRRGARSVGILVLAFSLTGCQITLREPIIEPLNTNRFYEADLALACDAAEQVAEAFGLELEDRQREDSACLFDTDYKVFSDQGDDPMDHLRRVAMIGAGGFIGGRYALTVTTRDVRNGGTRVRVTTRIEGYISEEFGYQVVRSNGLIEDTIFAAIGTRLGAAPVEGR